MTHDFRYAITFVADDVEATAKGLKARGVECFVCFVCSWFSCFATMQP